MSYLTDLNPHIRYAKIHKTAYRMDNNTSICYDCRIFFFRNITGSIIINGTKYDIRDKTAIYLPPQTKYRFNVIFTDRSDVFVFDFDLITQYAYISEAIGTATVDNYDPKKVLAYALPADLSQPFVGVIPQIENWLHQCIESISLNTFYNKEESSAILKLCLLQLMKQIKTDKRSDLYLKTMECIRDHYDNHTLTNIYIAEALNYHPFYLSQKLKEETGKTLHQLLIEYRISKAKSLLSDTELNISEISWKTGFSSESYFIKTFRKETGMTPRKYRLQQFHREL